MNGLTTPALCRSCGAVIVWARTRSGKLMPIDPDPHEDGNVVIDEAEDGTLRATVHPRPPRHLSRATWRSHFATCPQADAHRRREVRS